MDNKKTIRSVERALDILLCFLQRSSLSLTEIAKITQLNKSTVYRLLATLESKGFLTRNVETEKYQLGFRIWELSVNLDHDPAVLFLTEMERLRDEIDETVSLYIRDGSERIRIQAVESQQAIRRVAPIGARMSLLVGASSKVLMAYTEPEIVQQVLRSSEEVPAGIDLAEYKAQLQTVKQNGYAISMEEREAGTAAIAVPIFSRGKRIVAALAVSGPVHRMNDKQMKRILPKCQQAANRMGQIMKA